MMRYGSFLCFLAFFLTAQANELSHSDIQFFENNIRPILAENCYKCHSKDSKKLRGNLLLDSKAGWMAGGEHGPAIEPGKPEKSLLIKAISYKDKHLKMPPDDNQLSPKQIALLTQWIKMGAPDPRKGDQEYVKNRSKLDILKSQKNYWAFKKLDTPKVPTNLSKTWAQNNVDHYILSKLKSRGLEPNDKVSKVKLIRRLYFDIIGLPPEPEAIDRYLADASKEATSKVIDELLNSPHFGERWARHWMDVARFAESFGFEQDYDRPYAYYYRDFLIKAFNEDLPYNQFVQWQIAGDEIEPDNPFANMATGFLAGGVFPTQLTEAEFETARYDELDDVVGTVGTAFMGLTLSCARCHTHKYDPIPIEDYYRFTAAFATTIRSIDNLQFEKGSPFLKADQKAYEHKKKSLENYSHKSLFQGYKRYWGKLKGKVEKTKAPENIQALMKKKPDDLSKEEQTLVFTWYKPHDAGYKKLKQQKEELENNLKDNRAKVMVMSEGLKHIPHHADGRGYPHFYENVHHLKRGNVATKEEVAKAGFLQVLTYNSKDESQWIKPAPEGAHSSHRRKALSEWMVDTEDGAGHLVARVIVNRIWKHYLGRGIVRTPNDFGRQGIAPTHPELLDYLAHQLIQNNWSLKSVHRLILNSATYALSAEVKEASKEIDPDNHLFWRRPLKRLESEVMRDSMLSISKKLDTTLYGPSQKNLTHDRRSVYFFLKRSKLIPMMRLFDMPSPLTGEGERQVTTIAPQALMFMNSPEIHGYAEAFAKRINAPEKSSKDIVNDAYRLALGHSPNEHELKTSIAYLDTHPQSQEALLHFSKALMSLNEFIYID